jgi:hypothetical protein
MPIAVSSVGRFRVSMLCAVLALHGGRVGAQEPEAQEPAAQESAAQPADLMGEWCLVRKRMVTKYTVTAGKLQIRGGRSGHLHEADLRCDDAYTRCEANPRDRQMPDSTVISMCTLRSIIGFHRRFPLLAALPLRCMVAARRSLQHTQPGDTRFEYFVT